MRWFFEAHDETDKRLLDWANRLRHGVLAKMPVIAIDTAILDTLIEQSASIDIQSYILDILL